MGGSEVPSPEIREYVDTQVEVQQGWILSKYPPIKSNVYIEGMVANAVKLFAFKVLQDHTDYDKFRTAFRKRDIKLRGYLEALVDWIIENE